MGTEDDDVRVGNPERERVISLLNDAFSTGYLDITEFEERTGVVYSARTRGELKPLVADLPNGSALFHGSAIAGSAISASGPLVGGGQPLELNIDWDTVRKKGSWQVPPRLSATGSMGNLHMDVRRATFTTAVVELELQVSASTVKLRLGPDHEVRYDELSTSGWSDVKDKAGPPARPGGPVIIVRGSLSAASSLSIRR
jgi:hypothetical protein